MKELKHKNWRERIVIQRRSALDGKMFSFLRLAEGGLVLPRDLSVSYSQSNPELDSGLTNYYIKIFSWNPRRKL